MVFARMLEMKVLLDSTPIKKHPTVFINSIKFKKDEK